MLDKNSTTWATAPAYLHILYLHSFYQGEITSNIRLTEIVFIMVLLLWKDTMTKTTYKRKPFIGASVQFHGERGNSQAGMVQEQ